MKLVTTERSGFGAALNFDHKHQYRYIIFKSYSWQNTYFKTKKLSSVTEIYNLKLLLMIHDHIMFYSMT